MGLETWNSGGLLGDPPHTQLGPQAALYQVNLNSSSSSANYIREVCLRELQRGKEN